MKRVFVCSTLMVMAVCMFVPRAAMQSSEEETVKDAWASIEGFYEAFNRADNDAMQEFMTFPHLFLTREGRVSVQEERWEMNFDRMREREDWAKSTLDSHEVTMVFSDKVHFKIAFSRHNSKGERYSTMEGIYIATKKEGKWGLQVRSY